MNMNYMRFEIFHSVAKGEMYFFPGGPWSLLHPFAGRVHSHSGSAHSDQGRGIPESCPRKRQQYTSTRSLDETTTGCAGLVWRLQLKRGVPFKVEIANKRNIISFAFTSQLARKRLCEMRCLRVPPAQEYRVSAQAHLSVLSLATSLMFSLNLRISGNV